MASAPAAAAKRAALNGSAPPAIATANAPQNASPAPVVSIGVTENGGIRSVAIRCVDLDPLATERRDHGLDTDVEAPVDATERLAFVFVGDHDRAPTEQLVRKRDGGCRIEDRHSAAGPGLREGIGDDADRDLQLTEDHDGVGEGSGAQLGVGPRDDDDRVLPGMVDGDQGAPRGRRGASLHGCGIDRFLSEDHGQSVAGCVVTKR